MKTKILPALILVITSLSPAFAEKSTPSGDVNGDIPGSQKVVVNNYYYQNGYDFASRINRFHRSYITFDFYSPLYTEVYWYRYKPYTWGVSIYDDWYYYGSVATRYTWRSGFGGSYWWGYDRWWDYNPWKGYGWSSWYSPGVSFSVNFYLGRPNYHYPVAWNRWHQYNYRSFQRSINIVNNNNTYNYYYGSQRRDGRQSPATGYNPSHPYSSELRPGYTVTGGRSSVSGSSNTASASGRSQASSAGSSQSTGEGSGRGNNAVTTGNQGDRENGNNGLRMGQYRRGVAQPANPGDNGLPRTNNPNVNDRTNPGREQGNSANSQGQQTNTGNASGQQRNPGNSTGQPGNPGNSAGQQGNASRQQSTITQGNRRQTTGENIPGAGNENVSGSQGNVKEQTGVVRAPARSAQPQQTQSRVRTFLQRLVPTRRQERTETSSQSQESVKQNTRQTGSQTTGKKEVSEKSSSTKRRNR